MSEAGKPKFQALTNLAAQAVAPILPGKKAEPEKKSEFVERRETKPREENEPRITTPVISTEMEKAIRKLVESTAQKATMDSLYGRRSNYKGRA